MYGILNINTFLLGTYFAIFVVLNIIIQNLLCKIWKVRVNEFGIFYNPRFSIYSKTYYNTIYTLGWIPLGAYLKPFGIKNSIDIEICEDSSLLRYAFYNKPKYKRVIIQNTSMFIYIIAVIALIFLLSDFKQVDVEARKIGNYLISAIISMFTGVNSNEDFILQTKAILENKNTVLFAFTIAILLILFLSLFVKPMQWFGEKEDIHKVKKVIGFIIFIAFIYFCFWKIPGFLLSFFTLGQLLIYLYSLIFGLFISGCILYFLLILSMKLISRAYPSL